VAELCRALDRCGQRVLLGDGYVAHHAAGDFPAIVGQFGQFWLVAQTVLSLTVQDQRLDNFADEM